MQNFTFDADSYAADLDSLGFAEISLGLGNGPRHMSAADFEKVREAAQRLGLRTRFNCHTRKDADDLRPMP